jgi:pilus assembly protein CpaF
MNSPGQPAPTNLRPEDISKLKGYLVNAINQQMSQANIPAENRPKVIDELLLRAYQQARVNLPEMLRAQVFRDVQDEGFGPIQKLLMKTILPKSWSWPKWVYVERKGVTRLRSPLTTTPM